MTAYQQGYETRMTIGQVRFAMSRSPFRRGANHDRWRSDWRSTVTSPGRNSRGL